MTLAKIPFTTKIFLAIMPDSAANLYSTLLQSMDLETLTNWMNFNFYRTAALNACMLEHEFFF